MNWTSMSSVLVLFWLFPLCLAGLVLLLSLLVVHPSIMTSNSLVTILVVAYIAFTGLIALAVGYDG